MADRIEQRAVKSEPEGLDQSFTLERLSAPAQTEHDPAVLEKANFSFAVEKDSVEREQETAVQRSPEAPRSEAAKRTSRTASARSAYAARRPSSAQGLTILDRLMNFIADLLARLDRALFLRARNNRSPGAAEREGEEELIQRASWAARCKALFAKERRGARKKAR